MLLQDLMRRRKTLSSAERSIADYLLVQREKVAEQSARQIAREVYTAPSTVVRFCKKFGFAGYDDFRKAFITELGYLTSHFDDIDPNYPFSFGERRIVVANKVGQLYRDIIDDTLRMLDEGVLDRAVGLLDSAYEICVFSAGVQADIAHAFADKMLKIGCNVVVERRANAAYYRAAHAMPGTVFVVLSYSGETDQLIRVAKKIRECNASLIAITSYGGSSLADLADVVLYVSTREKLVRNLGHFAMNISSLLLFDVLYAGVFNENYYANFQSRVDLRRGFESQRSSNNPILNDSVDDDELLAELADLSRSANEEMLDDGVCHEISGQEGGEAQGDATGS